MDAAIRPLARWIAQRVVASAERRAAAGRLEFHDLLVLARRLLRTDPEVRESLHGQSPGCCWTSSRTPTPSRSSWRYGWSRRLFDGLVVLPIDAAAAWRAGQRRREHAARGVTLCQAECLIAAAAFTNRATLVTAIPRTSRWTGSSSNTGRWSMTP